MTPGIYRLTDLAGQSDYNVGAAGDVTFDTLEGLEGASAIALAAWFGYEAGGTGLVVTVETAFFNNSLWLPIARFDFATATAAKHFNLSGLTPKVSPYTLTALGAEGAIDGLLGDRLRCRASVTGTYTGACTLAVRAAVR